MIWNFTSSTASSDAASSIAFSGGGRTRPLTVVRHAASRGMRLSVDPRDATVRLTLAKRAALKPALAWAEGKRSWVEAELARLPQPNPIVPGMIVPIGGVDHRLVWRDQASRRVVQADGEIVTGGPIEQLGPRVLRHLRAHALQILDAETRAMAAKHGLTIGGVGVGDPKSRWGSCSSSGDIRYSWRLILAPASVLHATVAHELAHRVHMNHGAAFHALCATFNGGDPSVARAWLRAHGTALHWFGCAG